ncbi:mitochondrial fission regulator 1-like [Prorops nasuta]|uniref:mitochondrial fission regulator 1-like n=1 Tax=Prorops nasuta TaxID=863751 RepID=UPI0034CDA72D
MEPVKCYGKKRSIVRRIGSFLPLRPPPKIYVSVTPLHSMTSSMINEETSSNNLNNINGLESSRIITGSRPDLLEPINFGSEVRLLALEQELQDLREQISVIVKNSKHSQYASASSLASGSENVKSIPLPLAYPLPCTPHIARRASLQEHKLEDKKKTFLISQKSIGNILIEIDKATSEQVERSSGEPSLCVKRANSPCNDLQEILRKRYVSLQ